MSSPPNSDSNSHGVRPKFDDDDVRRIRVKNLAFAVTEEELLSEMARHGPVVHVHLPRHDPAKVKQNNNPNPRPSRSLDDDDMSLPFRGRGYAFVYFATAADAIAARETVPGTLLGGRAIVVAGHTSTSKGRSRAKPIRNPIVRDQRSLPAPKKKLITSRNKTGRRAKQLLAVDINKRLTSAESAVEILAIFENEGASFSHVNFATCLNRLGRSLHTNGNRGGASSDPRLPRLVVTAAESVRTTKWSPRSMANAASGVAKLHAYGLGQGWLLVLLEAVAAASVSRLSEFPPLELSSVAQSLAKAGTGGAASAPAFFDAAAATAEPALASYSPRDLSSLCWSFATFDCAAPALFARVETLADRGGLASFDPQSLAATSWSFKKLNVDATALFAAVAHEVTKCSNALNPQDVIMIVWSFVGSGAPGEAYNALARSASRCILDYKAAQLGQLSWGFAAAGVDAPELFADIAAAAVARADELSGQDIAQLAWSFDKASVTSPTLIAAIKRQAATIIDTLTPQDLSNLASAAVGWRDSSNFFSMIAKNARGSLLLFKPQELAILASAFSAGRVHAPILLEAIATEVVARDWHDSSIFKAEGIARLAFAFGNLEHVEPDSSSAALPEMLVRELLERAASGDANVFDGLTATNSITACGCQGLWREAMQLLELYLLDGDGDSLDDVLNAAAVVLASSGDEGAIVKGLSLITDSTGKFAVALATTNEDTQFTVHNSLLVGARRMGHDSHGEELQRRINAAGLKACRPEAFVELPATKTKEKRRSAPLRMVTFRNGQSKEGEDDTRLMANLDTLQHALSDRTMPPVYSPMYHALPPAFVAKATPASMAQSLSRHAEKKALAALCAARVKPLHVEVNFKMCADCHLFFKAAAKHIGEDITVRERCGARQLHQFDGASGLCSCGDRWRWEERTVMPITKALL